MMATIICVGTELLNGLVQESNSYYITNRLKEQGVQVVCKHIVEDNLEHVKEALALGVQNSQLVLVTGGLGPTLDDLTREAIAEFLHEPLELDNTSKEKIIHMMTSRHRSCTENNFRQAYFPRGSRILENPIGTAPGFMVDYKGSRILALPGPPKEMKRMLDEYLMELLKGYATKVVRTKRFDVFGIGESALEDRLSRLFQSQTNPVIATYASTGAVTLLVTATGSTHEEAEELLQPFTDEIYSSVGEYIYSETGEVLEEVVYKLLKAEGLKLSTAESCTGGLLAARLTRIPGASSVYNSGFITYSNEAKIKDLKVPAGIIEDYGAVSRETALAMLMGLKEVTGSSCCVSVTGIAGPDGGSEEKPVGLVLIGININECFAVHQFNFIGERERIQIMSVLSALDLLRRGIAYLNKDKK